MIYRLLVLFIFGKFCAAKRYDNYTLFRGIPVEDHHIDFFRNLSDVYDINFWREPGSLRMPVEFVIGPNDKRSFLEEADKYGIYLTTIMHNVQSAFDQQTVKHYVRRKMSSFNWNHFYDISGIYNWLYDLEKAYPREVSLEVLGKTYENKEILAARVILNGSMKRSKVIIEGGIHAREWISPAFVTYMLYRIVHSGTQGSSYLRTVALTYEWYFIPVLNPDGYDYTFKQDRLWRKNRYKSGTDLNRNFAYGFGTVGISRDRRSEIYCGEHALSERESSALASFIKRNSYKLEYYISFHSYGQYIIIPFASSKKHVENFDEVVIHLGFNVGRCFLLDSVYAITPTNIVPGIAAMQEIRKHYCILKSMGLNAAQIIRSKYGKIYDVGTAYDTVGYIVGGSSTDWVKKALRIPYVMTFELRDQGSFGFALPASQILPTCEETLAGVLTLLVPPRDKLKISKEHLHDSQGHSFLDKIVIVCNVLLFIIVRFD